MNQLVTPRESQIAEQISFGRSYKEIADLLGISVNTVDTINKNLKRKTGLQKSSEITLAVTHKKHNIPVFDLPPDVKKRIAAALLVLSIYSIALVTTDFVRVLRPVRTSRTSSRSGRKSSKNTYYLKVA